MISIFLATLITGDPHAGEEYFEKVVRPILVDRCQKCHGAVKQNGGLRLDSKSAVWKGGESGPAILKDLPAKSLLLQAVARQGDVSPMPPQEKLTADEIQKLKRWVETGAAWPDSPATHASAPALGDQSAYKITSKSHWAFQPIRNRPAPQSAEDWPRTKLDRFVADQWRVQKLKHAEDADRRTLIRRATYDLHGLPPTPKETAEFISDVEPTHTAFEKVVDRLLASPKYGERWGRHWLDVARYADTKGYVFQEERRYPYSYTYRDWVVAAFNRDMPFDRMLKEQLAADQLPDVDGDGTHLAAMGFLTVGRRFLQDIQEITDDRIDVSTRGLMGLTVACARCHDHKYDAISAADYYSLYGVFMGSEEPKELPKIAASHDSLGRLDFESKLAKQMQAVSQDLKKQKEVSQTRMRANAAKYFRVATTVSFQAKHAKLEAECRNEGLPVGGFRLWLERWNAAVADSRKKPDPLLSTWATVFRVEEKSLPVEAAKLATELKKPGAATNPGVLVLLLPPPKSRLEFTNRVAGAIADPGKNPKAAAAVAGLLAGPFSIPDDKINAYFDRKQREHHRKLNAELESLKAKHPGADARAMVMIDKSQPFEPHILLRGNPGRPGPRATRKFVEVISPADAKPFKKGSGRLEFAEAVVSPKNPLTARVIVNRVWQWHFGTGLAPSASDFGLRSDTPSHPELLDDLAANLIAHDWSLKWLHRTIMNSRTYQLSSVADQKALAADPPNRWYARFPRRRLEWEPIRDSMLFVAGKLDAKMGGQPTPLFPAKEVGRRTLYGFIDRQNLDGAFRTFDFASTDATSPKRFATTVPQQALFFMNAPFTQLSAASLASRTAQESSDRRGRIEAMFQLVYSRSPQPEELGAVDEYLSAEIKALGPERPWTQLAQTLLMSNEFLFVD